jgi:hypothetical protein
MTRSNTVQPKPVTEFIKVPYRGGDLQNSNFVSFVMDIFESPITKIYIYIKFKKKKKKKKPSFGQSQNTFVVVFSFWLVI